MEILNELKIRQKLKRIALEICERNSDREELVFIGVNQNGLKFAELLLDQLKGINSSPSTKLHPIQISKNLEIGQEIVQFDEQIDLNGKAVILVDDVSSSGRTLFYAFRPILKHLASSVQVAVLIDRSHKLFPVHADYVGLSLATTIQEHIEVYFPARGEMSAILQ